MNHRIIERLWKALSNSRLGRITAAVIIGALFAFVVAAGQPNRENLVDWTIVGAVMGATAVGILELIDRDRRRLKKRHHDQSRHSEPAKFRPVQTRSAPPPIPTSRSSDSSETR